MTQAVPNSIKVGLVAATIGTVLGAVIGLISGYYGGKIDAALRVLIDVFLSVPSLLFLSRGGKRIHFLADWNYRVWPGIGLMYRRAEVVTVLRKPGRPRALNFLKALYAHDHPPRVQARMHLAAGRSIGIFPEGQVNPDPGRMLRGRHGAARLSLELGVPVVPMGIRFPNVPSGEPIPGNAPMALHIGAPVLPMKSAGPQAPLADVRAWHAAIHGISKPDRPPGAWTLSPRPRANAGSSTAIGRRRWSRGARSSQPMRRYREAIQTGGP